MKLANATCLYFVVTTTAYIIISPANAAFLLVSSSHRVKKRSYSIARSRVTRGCLWLPSLSSTGYSRRLVQTLARGSSDDDDDDEEEEEDDVDGGPLSKGIESVSWLPSVRTTKSVGEITSTQKDAVLLPLFPLGGIVYTPNSEHILNIFEPRYREMYTDILMNGTKRFVVSMSHPTEPGRFAQTGVLFELGTLKEVSEQTGDRIKYVCNHKVTGRVKIHRILNPEAWDTRETYLRVEGTIIDDSGKNIAADEEIAKKDIYGALAAAAESNPTEEKALRDAFADLVDRQHELEEDIRFTRASVVSLAVKPGPGPDGLWQTIRLWQSFADQRLMYRQNQLQRDFQEKLQEFLRKEKGLKDEELPSAIGFQELSPALQKEVKELQKRMTIELQPLVLESTLTMQKLLEADSHTERLKLVRYFVEAETQRLATKKALQGMFSGAASSTGVSPDAAIPPEEQVTEDKASSNRSFFMDEPDAFQ